MLDELVELSRLDELELESELGKRGFFEGLPLLSLTDLLRSLFGVATLFGVLKPVLGDCRDFSRTTVCKSPVRAFILSARERTGVFGPLCLFATSSWRPLSLAADPVGGQLEALSI